MSSEKRFEAIRSIADLKVEGPGTPAPASIDCYGEDVFNLEAMRKHLRVIGNHLSRCLIMRLHFRMRLL